MKNSKLLQLIAVAIPLLTPSFQSQASNDLKNDIGSQKVKHKIVKVGDKTKNVYVYYRKSMNSQDFKAPDYFYLWHGQKQTAYPFMNLTGLMGNTEDQNRPKALFLALDDQDGEWKDSAFDSNLMEVTSFAYKNELDSRSETSLGYDTGVAQAFSFACLKGVDYALLSAGGLFSSESCKPKGLGVVYHVNEQDQVFPLDQSNSFSVNGSNFETLRNRLDGESSIAKLRQLLGCTSPVTSTVVNGIKVTHSCSNGNQLTVVKSVSNRHQWNGYENVSAGAYNMEGYSDQQKVTNWLNTEFSIK